MINKVQIKVKNNILIVKFKSKAYMNEILDPVSNNYEGVILNRLGHNFPSSVIPNKFHMLSKYKTNCQYVIGVYNVSGMAHELLHAKFYMDYNYKKQICDEWNELTDAKRDHIVQFLKSMGYSDKVIIDEYQAYKYSEPANFFGIKF